MRGERECEVCASVGGREAVECVETSRVVKKCAWMGVVKGGNSFWQKGKSKREWKPMGKDKQLGKEKKAIGEKKPKAIG
jgi:hypothetical protein